MRIIDKIEVNYFRSAYSIALTDLRDITIFIGENDSGKSNILKSLNLFFNNETEHETAVNFTEDISRTREKEAKKAKGRLTIWIKITFNNFRSWQSLPEKFYIKKSWTRYSPTPDVKFSDGINGTTIGRFLSSIKFHYIPPIRSREIFSCYLNLLHDSLIDDEKAGISDSSGVLMKKINESTESMADKIQTALGIQSTIDVPKDLRVLFSALDFTTRHNDFFISLQKRGDGLQTRHIPYILDFVARRSKIHHIWAYEEPENSLEISKAYELAEQFKSEFSVDNQIFITTHSPAFYDISGDKAKRFHVFQAGNGHETDLSTNVAITNNSDADSFVGTAAFIASRTKDLIEEHKSLKESNAELSAKLKEANLPQIVVEGPTDKIIFDKALDVFFPDEHFCEVVAANCATKLQSYLTASGYISRDGALPIVGIFDNDDEGRKAFDSIKNTKSLPGIEGKIISQNKRIYALILPLPPNSNVIQKKVRDKINGEFKVSIPIEFMFSKETLQEAIINNKLRLKDIVVMARDRDTSLPVNVTSLIKPYIPDDFQHFASQIDDTTKKTFAEWLCEQGSNKFEPLRPFLAKVKELLG